MPSQAIGTENIAKERQAHYSNATVLFVVIHSDSYSKDTK
eukprot:SAG31_NODE_40870_length_278_cov_1.726257_1_plen_39_part_10